jgi:hypothetical protein
MSRSRGGVAAVGVLAGLVVLLALLGAGWWFRDDILRLVGREPEPVEVSPEAAALAEGKIDRLRTDGDTARLSSVEVSSLLRYRGPAWLGQRFHEPSVAFAADTARVSGTIATSELPSHPELDRVRVLLPDSSRVELSGVLDRLPSGRMAVEIDRVTFAGIPIPARYYPDVLERFGRRDEPGLAPTAIAVDLPPGVGGARVEGGYLVLTPP